MALQDQTTLRIVLYEGEGSEPLPASDRFDVLSTLLDRGFRVTRAGDERPLAANGQAALLVLGRFNEGRAPMAEDAEGRAEIRFQDIRGFDAARVGDRVETARLERKAIQPGEWKPWFPVIDYDRCTNCMQCLSFCLFGVYGVDEAQKIQVQNNDNCKTNCPACSRVCPEAAIMFPKYKAGPINGDVVSAADLQREKMKVDISALLGGDVYSLLRERSEKAKSRFSKERDADKALKERQKCLVKLAQAGDIPAEVLMSLPSPDEIARRAVEAKAKAQAALANRQVAQ
jgi:Pyruvate/2-oxoacid:ferredoxin oxidoreductase delta subunit